MPTGFLRPWAAAVLALVLVAACGSNGTTPPAASAPPPATGTPAASGVDATPGPDPLEVYRQIAADVVAIRGLDAPERTDPKVIDEGQLRANLAADFEASNPKAQILLSERVYRALGLLPAGVSLEDVYLELQGSQVIGYYDPKVDELFIVSRSGSLGPTERLTYAHEFTHELQDRHFDLESLGLEQSFDQGDRGLAVLGLVEGDAVSVQTTWMTERLTPADLLEVAAEASDPQMLAVLGRTPAIVRETALYPYQAGPAFVATLLAQGGYDAVNAAFERPPASTEQVLHPDKYLSGEAPAGVEIPTDLAARFGTGWSLDAQDTLGELQLRVWLREGGATGDVARVATEGWGGDRIGLLAAPGDAGDVVVLSTAWDTSLDAAEFRAAAEGVVSGLGHGGAVVASGRRVVVSVGVTGPQGAELRSLLGALAQG